MLYKTNIQYHATTYETIRQLLQLHRAVVSMSTDHLVSRRFDWDDVTPVIGVVRAVSDAGSVDLDAVPMLAETVDPESLNDLCTSASTQDPVTVSFVHAGYDVTVRSDGLVVVDTA